MSATTAHAVVIAQHRLPAPATGVFASSGGLALTGVYSNSSVTSVTTNTNVTLTRVPGPPASFVETGPDGNPWAIASSASGAAALYEITTTGATLRFTFPADFDPTAFAVGPDRALWFVDSGKKIDRYQPADGTLTSYSLPPGKPAGGWPTSIVSGPGRALWFTDTSSGMIDSITTSGQITEHLIADSDTEFGHGFMAPVSITEGPDHALWFVEANNERIGRMTEDGELQEFVIPNLSGCQLSCWSGALGRWAGPPEPRALTSGPDNAMWFTDDGTDSIGRVTSSGQMTEYHVPNTPGTETEREGGVAPVSIVLGSDDKLYFTEANARQLGSLDVYAMSIPPTPTTAARVLSRGCRQLLAKDGRSRLKRPSCRTGLHRQAKRRPRKPSRHVGRA